MLTQYQLTLSPGKPCFITPEWSFRFYAALLEKAPREFGDRVHEDAVTPVSQYLQVYGDKILWMVNLLGECSEKTLCPVLDALEQITLRDSGRQIPLPVTEKKRESIADVDELFARSTGGGEHCLRFCTPTAFKSQQKYLILPSARLILQNLIRRWNGCITECPIEDDNDEGLEAMAAGLYCGRYDLRSTSFRLKGHTIPGFTGELTLQNQLQGFHRELADALLYFSTYAGVGIKTTLGMGGVIHHQNI